MNQLTLSDGTVLIIDKLSNQDCQFVSLKSTENILGELPKVELVVRADHDLLNVLDEVTITINNPNGYQLESNLYVYSISSSQSIYTIKLMGPGSEFIRKIKTNVFSNFKSAITSLYPWNIESNTDTDLLNDCKIYQMQETDYHLLTKLLKGYKKNVVFGYALSGLRLIDLKNYKSALINYDRLVNFSKLDAPELTSPKLYDLDTEFVDYSDGVDPNHTLIRFDKNLIPVNNEYKDLVANTIYNRRFESTKSVSNKSSRELIPLNICDGVKVNQDVEISDIFVSSRTIMIDTAKIQVDYTLRSINP